MSEWKEYKLDDLASEITVGFVGPMSTEYKETGVPFLRSQNIKPYKIDFY
jgi:type I restriction enzyme S subunit